MADISQIKLPNGDIFDLVDESKSTATNWVNGSQTGSIRAINSAVEGSSYTIGQYAVAEGQSTKATGKYSHAEGGGTTASGTGSHAEGAGTQAKGANSHAEGGGAIANGHHSHAEGGGTTASGDASHAEGGGTQASGQYSHAEGASTVASNNKDHAEGYQTTASGGCAHAEGYGTVASGLDSHAEGDSTIANHLAQHVFGQYNIADTSTATTDNKGKYVEIVGNGSYNARSNARTLDWSGNEVLSGKLTVGVAGTNSLDVATIGQLPTTTSQLTNDSGFITSHQDISGKADKDATVSNIFYDSTNRELKKTINGVTSSVVDFGTAAFKLVTTTIASDSVNLPTGAAVAAYVDSAISTASKPMLSGSTSTITPTQVATALANGQNIELSYTDATYGTGKAYSFNYSDSLHEVVANVMFQYGWSWICCEIHGNTETNNWGFVSTSLATMNDIPSSIVTSIATGAGLTGGPITTSGTIKANLNSETSLGTIGTTDKLYAVGVDSNGKLAVNVPWTGGADYVVTLTESWAYEATEATYTWDKTFAEIKAAIDAKKDVVLYKVSNWEDEEGVVYNDDAKYKYAFSIYFPPESEESSAWISFTAVSYAQGTWISADQIALYEDGSVEITSGDSSVDIPTATDERTGIVKPWYYHQATATGITVGHDSRVITVNARTTTTGRYYGVETDANGYMFVNVPWETNTDEKVAISNFTTGNLYFAGTSEAGTSSGTTLLNSNGFRLNKSNANTYSLIIGSGSSNDLGQLWLGKGIYRAKIRPSSSQTNDIILYLPDEEGTIALTSDIPTISYPVTSVNGQTGTITLSASDVGAQSTLVSGTNIKTINGNSLLGSGDITITNGLQNLVDGSAEGSLVGVNAGSVTTNPGTDSLALGYKSDAAGVNSVAAGYWSSAGGNCSFALGDKLIAQRKHQTVIGKFNIADTGGTDATTDGDSAFIIGNGTSDQRSNALTVDWNGNAVLAGKVTVGTVGTNSMDVATVGQIPSVPSNLSDLINDCGFAKIHISTTEPTSTDGEDGDIWITYE